MLGGKWYIGYAYLYQSNCYEHYLYSRYVWQWFNKRIDRHRLRRNI